MWPVFLSACERDVEFCLVSFGFVFSSVLGCLHSHDNDFSRFGPDDQQMLLEDAAKHKVGAGKLMRVSEQLKKDDLETWLRASQRQSADDGGGGFRKTIYYTSMPISRVKHLVTKEQLRAAGIKDKDSKESNSDDESKESSSEEQASSSSSSSSSSEAELTLTSGAGGGDSSDSSDPFGDLLKDQNAGATAVAQKMKKTSFAAALESDEEVGLRPTMLQSHD